MDPNSRNQRWSKWTTRVAPDGTKRPIYQQVKAVAAVFYRKLFGSASALKVTEQWRPGAHGPVWTFECLTEGHPVHDPGFVDAVTRRIQHFMLVGFGPRSDVSITADLAAGSWEDGRPTDQLIIAHGPLIRIGDLTDG